MATTKLEQRREDDAFNRKVTQFLIAVMVGLSVAFISGVASYIYMVSAIQNQVENNTEAIAVLSDTIKQMNAFDGQLSSIQTHVQILSQSVSLIHGKVDNLSAKLNRFTPVVDRADRYIDEHIKNHQNGNGS